MCEIARGLTYDQSRVACENIGMPLFIVSSAAVQKAFLHMISTRFADRAHARVWINGRKKHENHWYPENQNLHLTNINWFRSASSGECLSTTNSDSNRNMLIDGWNCGSIAWAYCEFINPELNNIYNTFYK